jgi:hypothetical protein
MAERVVDLHTRRAMTRREAPENGERDGAARAVLRCACGTPRATPAPAWELQAWRALRDGNEESGRSSARLSALLRGGAARRGYWGALYGQSCAVGGPGREPRSPSSAGSDYFHAPRPPLTASAAAPTKQGHERIGPGKDGRARCSKACALSARAHHAPPSAHGGAVDSRSSPRSPPSHRGTQPSGPDTAKEPSLACVRMLPHALQSEACCHHHGTVRLKTNAAGVRVPPDASGPSRRGVNPIAKPGRASRSRTQPLALAGAFAVVSAPASAARACSAVRQSAARPGALRARVPALGARQSDAMSACSGSFFFFWGCSKVQGRPDKFAARDSRKMLEITEESTSLEYTTNIPTMQPSAIRLRLAPVKAHLLRAIILSAVGVTQKGRAGTCPRARWTRCASTSLILLPLATPDKDAHLQIRAERAPPPPPRVAFTGVLAPTTTSDTASAAPATLAWPLAKPSRTWPTVASMLTRRVSISTSATGPNTTTLAFPILRRDPSDSPTLQGTRLFFAQTPTRSASTPRARFRASATLALPTCTQTARCASIRRRAMRATPARAHRPRRRRATRATPARAPCHWCPYASWTKTRRSFASRGATIATATPAARM